MASDKNTLIEKDDNPTRLEEDENPSGEYSPLDGGSGRGQARAAKTIKLGEAVYTLLNRLDVVSAEADLYLIASGSGEKFILKYYRPKIEPKPEVIELLKSFSGRGAVRIIETGRQAGRFYEIQEYAEAGTLADHIKTGATVPNSFIGEFISAAAECLFEIHSKNLIHRDIKPTNILIRKLSPLEIALTDFGISSVAEMSLHQTNMNRTVLYSSPESMSGVIAKATDYWSLGMILLEMAAGKNPFDGIDDKVVMFTLATKNVPLAAELKSEFSPVIKGLLTRNPKKRWGHEQVVSWLKGARDLPVYFGEPSDGDSPSRALRPYRFEGEDYFSLRALARPMSNKWLAAVREYESGAIRNWIARELGDRDALALLEDLESDNKLSISEKLFDFFCRIDPDYPFIYKGISVSVESLVKMAGKVINRSACAEEEKFLRDIFKLNIIKKYCELAADKSFYKTFSPLLETAWHFNTVFDFANIILLVFVEEYRKSAIGRIRDIFENCRVFNPPPGLSLEEAFRTARRIISTGEYSIKELVIFSAMKPGDYISKADFDSAVRAVREKFDMLDEQHRLKYYMEQLSDHDCQFIRELAGGGDISYTKRFYDKIVEIKKIFDSGAVENPKKNDEPKVRDNYTVVVIQNPDSERRPEVFSSCGAPGGADDIFAREPADSMTRVKSVLIEIALLFVIFAAVMACSLVLNGGPVSPAFLGNITGAFFFAVFLIYIPLFEYFFSATPAQMLCDIAVTDNNFKKLNIFTAALRAFARLAAVLGPGVLALNLYLSIFDSGFVAEYLRHELIFYLSALFLGGLCDYIAIDGNANSLALHDMLSMSMVVKRKSAADWRVKLGAGLFASAVCLFWLIFAGFHFEFAGFKFSPYMMRYIVETDISEGVKYGAGSREIVVAAARDDFDLVKYIADRRPDLVNARDDDGSNALFFAVRRGNYQVVKLLLEKKIEMNYTNKSGETPLTIACTVNNPDIVKLLCYKKAFTGIRNAHGQTPLIIAARAGYYDIVKLLLDGGGRLEDRDNAGFTALLSSAHNGDLRIFNLLLSRGAELNAFDYQGNSPLHVAAAAGNQALSEALVNKGVDINSRNVTDAATPLMAAIQNKRLETSRLLVEKGADVNIVNMAGVSPLMMAVEKNDAGLVGAMIARGADVNYQDSKGQTVLMTAASLASEIIIKLLVESGADPGIRNRTGQTAFDFYTRGRNYGRYTNDPRGYNRYPERAVLELLRR